MSSEDRREQRRKRRNLTAAHNKNKPKRHKPKTAYDRSRDKREQMNYG